MVPDVPPGTWLSNPHPHDWSGVGASVPGALRQISENALEKQRFSQLPFEQTVTGAA
jgi:hypothetical protein